METYIKQNKIQREVMNIINIFKVDWNRIRSLEERGIECFNIGASRKEKTGCGLILFSAVCPFTLAPVSIPLIYKLFLGGRR